MDFAGPLLEIVNNLCALASKPLGYIYNLKNNVRSLQKEAEDLKAMSEDVKARVEGEEEEAGAQRTKEVENWLGNVQKFVGEVDRVLREAGERDRIKCLGHYLPRNCRSSYKLGRRVDQMLNEARQLQRKGEFNIVTLRRGPLRELEMPMDKTMGLDNSLDRVLKWLLDEKQVGVIGLYGIGGVGKTTLMKRINNELSRANHGFDVVIWVVVSRQVNEDSIRDAIRKRLHVRDESWAQWSQGERVHHLYHVLTQKKFVLLIDDIWQRLDLSSIGIPHPVPESRSKVVFTTRLEHLCIQMGAEKTLKVQCLTHEEALKLFEKNVGKSLVDFHQEIRDLAKDIVEECEGLPLALITVGRAMAGKENLREWRHALTTLRNNPHKLSGMEEKVYHILELSYNSLDDATLQACFLYCCLFPEDYPIITDELIELWIGEGLLGGTNDVYTMRDKGESVLGDLKRACLLEDGRDDEGRQCVKMHDVVRDMATWIARDRGQCVNKLLVIEKDEDMSAEMISKWGEAEKISLWGRWIRYIDRTPHECSRLETLFIRNTEVESMPRRFFNSMTARLTVLDMSGNTKIESFPEEICNLINLWYLNLSATRICELPNEIKKLTRLRWLLVDDTDRELVIPTRAIASLPLNVFSNWSSAYYQRSRQSGPVDEEKMVEELGRVQHLTDLSITVFKCSSAVKIFQSLKFRNCIRRVEIVNCSDLTSIVISHSLASSGGFSHLVELRLLNSPGLVKMEITPQGIGRAPSCPCFPSLVEVWVFQCGHLNLSWLVHAPKLQRMIVDYCDSMEKIIGDEITREEVATSGLFSCLEYLRLEHLPNLTSICDQTVFFPRGVTFYIDDCPLLRKLPLDSNWERGSFSVEASPDWLAQFEWDPAAQVTVQLDDYRSAPVEMIFGEAVLKMKDPRSVAFTKIEF